MIDSQDRERKEYKLAKKLATLSSDERGKANITREVLNLLLKLYNSGELQEVAPSLIDIETNKIDLSFFNIVGQDLTGFDFSQFLLRYCNFSRSNFDEISAKTIVHRALDEMFKLIQVNMSNANLALRTVNNPAIGMTLKLPYNFSKLNLSNANFTRADLTGANFKEANLTQVNFSYSILNEAMFNQANVAQTNFDSAIFYPEQLVEAMNVDQAYFDNENIQEIIKNLKLKKGYSKFNLSYLYYQFIQKLRNGFKNNALLSFLFASKIKTYQPGLMGSVNKKMQDLATINKSVEPQMSQSPQSFVDKIQGAAKLKNSTEQHKIEK
ncbi:pentapeptide repeat-containing protein [Rickettsiales endosymbiont of Stachyamoeba lipophora]|uniref:pentapeptide repeat-containing protein n=1 Tax=Rickettsiales endosymbiont of Stachyamoeba lipophora TaxID=2486578 RepID=UPI0013DE6320|nr:pentapeptide repeat-containing protein [Rickettsiales endosymbiont of Stachyamoeba lipophora]